MPFFFTDCSLVAQEWGDHMQCSQLADSSAAQLKQGRTKMETAGKICELNFLEGAKFLNVLFPYCFHMKAFIENQEFYKILVQVWFDNLVLFG